MPSISQRVAKSYLASRQFSLTDEGEKLVSKVDRLMKSKGWGRVASLRSVLQISDPRKKILPFEKAFDKASKDDVVAEGKDLVSKLKSMAPKQEVTLDIGSSSATIGVNLKGLNVYREK